MNCIGRRRCVLQATSAQPQVENVLMNLDKLSDEYRGTSPRVVQGSTQYVFSASELPGFFPIPQVSVQSQHLVCEACHHALRSTWR